MKKELEEIQRILREKVVATVYNESTHQWSVTQPRPIRIPLNGDKVEMAEAGRSLLKMVTLEKLGPDTVVLKPDHFGTQYYRKIYNKGCDYVILTNDNQDKGHVVFVDMKGDIYNQPSSNGLLVTKEKRDASCGLQFCSSVALVKHLGQMVEEVSKCSRLRNGYKHHYWVLFSKYLNPSGVQGSITSTAGTAACEEVVVFKHSSLYRKIYTKQVVNGEVIDISLLLT